MKKLVLLIGGIVALTMTPLASGHATVSLVGATSALTNARSNYVVRVPNERANRSTSRVVLNVPESVQERISVQVVPGWNVRLVTRDTGQRDAEGAPVLAVTQVIWLREDRNGRPAEDVCGVPDPHPEPGNGATDVLPHSAAVQRALQRARHPDQGWGRRDRRLVRRRCQRDARFLRQRSGIGATRDPRDDRGCCRGTRPGSSRALDRAAFLVSTRRPAALHRGRPHRERHADDRGGTEGAQRESTSCSSRTHRAGR